MAKTASTHVVLALIVLTTVLLSILGLGTFAFGGPGDGPSQLLKLLWIGPLLALPILGLVAISRKLLIPAAFVLFLVNYIGSLVFMNGECSSGRCLVTPNSVLGFGQVIFGSFCTPQCGLSLILAVLMVLYRRGASRGGAPEK